MKEFIDKLINELEKLGEHCLYMNNWQGQTAICDAIEIVNQLAESYHIHCEQEYMRGYADAEKKLAEEYKVSEMPTGWIPCSERLPEDDTKRYIVQEKGGFINILGFTKDAFKQSKFDFYEYKGKKKALFYAWDSEYGYIERECVAWRELPAPYTEGE